MATYLPNTNLDTLIREAFNQASLAGQRKKEMKTKELQSQQNIASMHYGPGGAVDREIAAVAPLREAQAGYQRALAGGAEYATSLDKKKEADILAQLGMTTDAARTILPIATEERKYGLNLLKNEVEQSNQSLVPKVTPVAKPRKYAPWYTPGATTDRYTEFDADIENWRPYGNRILDTAARAGNNIAAAPNRMFSQFMDYLNYR
jgi:hypothetical protein